MYTAIWLDDSLGKWIEELAQKWYIEEVLEEVKDKEHNSINEFCILNGVSEEHRAILNTFLAIEHTKANRIIEKLREELDKLQKYIKDASQDRGTSDTNSIKWYLLCLSDVNNLLTSLEHPVSSSCSGDSSKTWDCYTESKTWDCYTESKTWDCYTEIKEENTCMTWWEWTEEQLKNSPMVWSMTKEEPEETEKVLKFERSCDRILKCLDKFQKNQIEH